MARGSNLNYDAVIFGGGPAGAAAALALTRKGFTVGLLAKPRHAPPVGETVPPEIIRPLSQLGLWETFRAADHAAAPGSVVIWGDERPFENDFLFNPYGPGWHLDRAAFDAMLLEAVRAAGTQVHECSVLDCARVEGLGWRARIDAADGGRTLVARWVIDATGRPAWLAKRAGARRHRVDRLIALVRFASASSLTEARTLIEACPDGWWYAAALPENRVVAAFFTDADLLPNGGAERVQFWDGTFAQSRLISSILPGFPAESRIRTVAACSGRVLPCAGRNWAAIGDAAQTYDPLSGQGIAKAMVSALQAAQLIAEDRLQNRTAIEGFTMATAREYELYLTNRSAHYRRERRWSRRPFWQRRQQGSRIAA
jgi:flavin-dependent dehydrogenase